MCDYRFILTTRDPPLTWPEPTLGPNQYLRNRALDQSRLTCILLIIISCSTSGWVSPVRFMVPSSMMKAWTEGNNEWCGGSDCSDRIVGILRGKIGQMIIKTAIVASIIVYKGHWLVPNKCYILTSSPMKCTPPACLSVSDWSDCWAPLSLWAKLAPHWSRRLLKHIRGKAENRYKTK